jgi:hypothetical protein
VLLFAIGAVWMHSRCRLVARITYKNKLSLSFIIIIGLRLTFFVDEDEDVKLKFDALLRIILNPTIKQLI